MWISDVSVESSNFDSEIPITAALVNLAIWLSSSIFGNKLLILRWRKCSPLCLKIFHSSWSNGWRLWKGPGLRLISPESNSSNRWYELELQYISCETDRKTDWECKWEAYRDSNLLINSMVKKCDRLQILMSWCGVWRWRCFTELPIKKKIASGIILTLTSGFCFISKWKNELVKNRNIKIAFFLPPLLPGFDLFISSLRLRLPSQLKSILTSTKLYVKL